MQHLLAITPVVSASGIRAVGAEAPSRAARARLHLLGPVHRHAVLPVGASALAARNLRGLGRLRRQAASLGSARRPQALDLGLCEPTSSLATVSEPLRAALPSLPEFGESAPALPLSLPAAAARRDEDRVVRLAVRLGGLEAHQGRDQTPSLARSSGLPAAVCRPHAGQDAGDRSGAPPAFSARHLPGLRPGVRGLRVVRTLDAPGRLLCHPPALRCALPRLREAPAAATRPHLVRPNRSTGQSLVSSAFAAAPHCGGGPGVGSPAGAVDQSSGPGLDHRGPPLRRALADRGLLSRPQAEPAHQDLRRHQRQRPEDSNLDRLDRHAGAQIPATARLLWLVLIQFGRLAAAATLRLSGLVRLAQSALRTPSGFGGGPSRATPAAGRRRSLNLDSTVPTLTATCPRNRAAQPPKPIRCNITTTGPPLIWTAVVYDRRPFVFQNFAAHRAALQETRVSQSNRCTLAGPRVGRPGSI